MGIIRKTNFRRHTRTLRTLDYENMSSSAMREGSPESGRLSDSLYEGTSRVPPRPVDPDEVVEEPTAHHPIAGERPHPRAQWDDVRGAWVVWDEEAGDWVPVEEPS
jgi:hypothetical protein